MLLLKMRTDLVLLCADENRRLMLLSADENRTGVTTEDDNNLPNQRQTMRMFTLVKTNGLYISNTPLSQAADNVMNIHTKCIVSNNDTTPHSVQWF